MIMFQIIFGSLQDCLTIMIRTDLYDIYKFVGNRRYEIKLKLIFCDFHLSQ